MIDLHVHTWRCRHAEGTADQYVRAAASCGVRTLGITDHLPLPPTLLDRIPSAREYAMPLGELGEYVEEVGRAGDLGNQIGVEVLLGIEIDAVPELYAHASELLSRHPFDVVLGSVHFIDDWAFDDPELIGRYEDWNLEDLWERYFGEMIDAARSGLADVVAHADLVKKFHSHPTGAVGHLYAFAADSLAEAGVAVEVNTAGLRKPCGEIYPAPAFLRELNRAGVPATVGSDAHAPGDVGAAGRQAVQALEDAGYQSVVIYRKRVAEEVALSDI
ncbi:MAG: histidinol-phosphatase HisJ family protein [Actinobacteria bacterium]|nr:histidinol-phosphatase HisJ family protein [Actinomycetota bacterium]